MELLGIFTILFGTMTVSAVYFYETQRSRAVVFLCPKRNRNFFFAKIGNRAVRLPC